MTGTKELMPRPPVIRERLAINLRERRILMGLLRIAERAAETGNPGGLIPERPDQAVEPRHAACA
jgi:hypothetical protein